ncbi:MAG TPA: alpha/beta hydrolase [Mycobacteriales bacterium]|nr:alpha/beta hydrolase [Mycobacteriales bacterium]
MKHEKTLTWASTTSEDGTTIAYATVGAGPGLILLGGVLSDADTYRDLAEVLADTFTVHIVNRRDRPGSGPMRAGHRIEDECADLAAVAAATGAGAVFGHSFGGLVALEAARRTNTFTNVCVYEPGVPLRGEFPFSWLSGYAERLARGDRRGAFAWMVKHNGFAPKPLAVMPSWYVKGILRLVIRGRRWDQMDALLAANLIEHRIEQGLDAAQADRFATITARTVLLAGDQSPPFIGSRLIEELAAVVPNGAACLLPGADHLAPQHKPHRIAAAVRSSIEPATIRS